MNLTELGTASNPVNVSLRAAKPPSFKDAIGLTLITVLPVALAVLMQKPALRQMLIMKGMHYGKEFCRWQATLWNKGGDACAQAYNKAKL